MLMILGQEVADPRTSSIFYKKVVQATLLFGAESWVMSPKIGRILGDFHHRLPLRLEKMQLNMDVMGRCIYLLLEAAMKAAGMEEVEMHIL